MEITTESQAVKQFLTFRLAAETYGIEVHKVREILDFPSITKVPRAPEFMVGVINLRGHVVPVVDLRRRFQIEAADRTKDSCIIVIEVELDADLLTIGIVGDSVEEVVDLFADQIEPPPKLGTQLNTEFIDGMGKQGEDFVLLLNIDKIFSAAELETVAALEEAS